MRVIRASEFSLHFANACQQSKLALFTIHHKRVSLDQKNLAYNSQTRVVR